MFGIDPGMSFDSDIELHSEMVTNSFLCLNFLINSAASGLSMAPGSRVFQGQMNTFMKIACLQ